MKNALQSKTEMRYICKHPNSCSAEKAIDGDLRNTFSRTHVKRRGWWMAEMVRAAIIEKIHLYLDAWQLKKGFLSKLTVFTKLNYRDAWTVCKGEFAVKGFIKPYEMKCNQEMNAKYVKISTARKKQLKFIEVKVFGPRIEGSIPSIYK